MNLEQLHTKGYTIINDIFTREEVGAIGEMLMKSDSSKANFRKTKDLFAIRQFLKEMPEVISLIFNANLKVVVRTYFSEDYFVVKSIYFDKPENSNWFVAWHQDLTISVNKKMDLPGFGPWTVKQDQYAVHPPLEVLENIFTLRIHLDDTDERNGALKVIPGSHTKGILRYSPGGPGQEEEICKVKSGGIMLMRPLLLHASNRTTDSRRRRVIHIEFSNSQLPAGLNWSEMLPVQ